MRVLDTSSGESYELRQLDGQAKLVFKITPERYLSGQTVCQGMLSSGQWVSDVCLTKIDAEALEAKCTCGLTKGVTQISFKDDLSQAEGEPIAFPAPMIASEFKGTSFFFMGLVSLISIAGLVSSLIAWRKDRKDFEYIKNLEGWKLELVKGVSAKLD